MGRFRDALAGPGLAAVAEIKRRSPSAGDIRPADGSTPPVLFTRLAGTNVLAIPVASTRGYAGMVDHRVLRVYDANDTVKQTIRLSGPLQSVAYDAERQRVAGNLGNPYGSGSTSGPLMVGSLAQRQSGQA